MRIWLGVCSALVVLGCAQAISGPTVRLNASFTLAPGETAAVAETGVQVQFMRVSGDSRCPSDVVCIQAGDAVVHLRVRRGTTTTDYQLHTVDGTRAALVHGGIRIALLELQPYPVSSRTIDEREYRVTLRASTA